MLVATLDNVYEIAENLLCQHCLYDAEPFSIERFPAHRLASPAIPVGSITHIAFLAMQVGVNPRNADRGWSQRLSALLERPSRPNPPPGSQIAPKLASS